MRVSSFGSSSRRSNYSRAFDLPDDVESAECGAVGGAMLPVFLNDLRQSSMEAATAANSNDQQELVELEIEVDDNNIVLYSVGPTVVTDEEHGSGGRFSAASSMLRQKFGVAEIRIVEDIVGAGATRDLGPGCAED
ncbi:hypothetical protein Ancab_017875 [Ancistrocladus abbreviatus]